VAAPKTHDINFFVAVAALLTLVGLSFWSRSAAFSPALAIAVRGIQCVLIVIVILLLVVTVRTYTRKPPPPAGTRPAGKALRSPFTRS
jgi:protein-S-isoprenylcysteine O-methyltransferase Ste14